MTEAEVTDLIAQYGIKLVQDAIIVTMEMKRDPKRLGVVKGLLDGRQDDRSGTSETANP